MSGKSEVHGDRPFTEEFIAQVKGDTAAGMELIKQFADSSRMPIGFFVVLDNFGGTTRYWSNVPPDAARALVDEALQKLESADVAATTH